MFLAWNKFSVKGMSSTWNIINHKKKKNSVFAAEMSFVVTQSFSNFIKMLFSCIAT